MTVTIGRRELLAALGGAVAAWPLAARAQQPKVPVIGFLDSKSARDSRQIVAAFHRGLNEAAFIEGQNVAIEYRWAENDYDRLPMLVADLVQRKVALIAAPDIASALAAKAATTTIPIVQHRHQSRGGRSRCQLQPARRQCYRHNVLKY